MSGKRAKSLRRKNVPPKKLLALCAGLCLSSVPLAAENEFLTSAFASFSMPFIENKTQTLDYGIGGGLRFTYRPVKFINLFAQGEYISMAFPSGKDIDSMDPMTIISGSIGAGYHFAVTDRFAIDLNANGGVYRAVYTDETSEDHTTNAFTAGVTLGFSYNVSPIVSIDTAVSGSHYVGSVKINGAAAPGLTVNITQLFNSATKVDMNVDSLAPVFPALYSWYEKNPFGKVTITNNEDSAITDITVSFFQPQYMAHAKECINIRKIEKGESAEVDLLAFFNEQMLELTEMAQTNSIVVVNYLCLGQKRTKTFSLDVPVYGRNNMSWDDDRRAAVFVSSKDPAAMRFAKHVTSIVREKEWESIPVNIQYAMGIFEALNQFGINYVIDPSSAFEDNVGTASIDFLQFPYQTLMFKGGDCDDLSILVCSLFEAVGIRTAFITIPGHIFMAFDSGMTVPEADEILKSLGNYIELDGEVWVPLEITLSDEGFFKAYRYGAREWNKAYAEGTSAIYRMQDSWEIYPPISVPGATAKFTLPTKKQVAVSFEKSVDQWSNAELKNMLSDMPVMLAENTDDSNNTETNNIEQNPFAVDSLFEVLALSGQEIAMKTIEDITAESRNISDLERTTKLAELYSEEDDDDYDLDDFGDDGIILPPVIAVDVLGPEELGITLDGQVTGIAKKTEDKTTEKTKTQTDDKTLVAKLDVKTTHEKVLPDRDLPSNIKPVDKTPVLTDNVKTDTTSKKLDTAEDTSVSVGVDVTVPTDKTVQQKIKPIHIPGLLVKAIAAIALAVAALIGIFIAKKQKSNEE
ncbi:MAG: DUF481 domain-containing protein [Treponema sp.]|nr:DUF481 domain-containing protein [Treponema sp.]